MKAKPYRSMSAEERAAYRAGREKGAQSVLAEIGLRLGLKPRRRSVFFEKSYTAFDIARFIDDAMDRAYERGRLSERDYWRRERDIIYGECLELRKVIASLKGGA